MTRPRLLIEEWLPAAAIGVECMRERGSASALAPTTYLHVWWARRPLTASRAAVLGSLLPADFPRDVFERLLGFGHSSKVLVDIRRRMDAGEDVKGGFASDRAFKRPIRPDDLERAHTAAHALWGDDIAVIDPMAGGGSIPLEAARLGFRALANEYNPVACSVLEATTDYPFRHGAKLAERARHWGREWERRVAARLDRFFPAHRLAKVHAYIFARTVACPDTQFATPLVPDWHLLNPKSGTKLVAEPVVDKVKGTWTIRIRQLGTTAGRLREAPRPTYSDGKGVSLFTDRQIPAEYIKAKAQAGEMRSQLYAIAFKTNQGLEFRPPEQVDLAAIADADRELASLRPGWERGNVIPTELYPEVSSDERPRLYGMPHWADLFAPRQLLGFGVLVEELRDLRAEILAAEGQELGEAVVHLLAFGFDKFMNHNGNSTRWENTTGVVKGKMDRHDFAFKPAFAEMAPCNAGTGLGWAIENVLEAYEQIDRLPRANAANAVDIFWGSATALPQVADTSLTAVVVDPPYADNVQYSELADFFYVWLKRTQGHRRPEWFASYLCEHDQEAVVNVSRHRAIAEKPKDAKARAHAFYQQLMTDTFRECRRILRDDGALTVMFTHKKQEAWAALFEALVAAGFTITATWPIKTESEHSLHQAKKNAAQSTVILVARKREPGAGVGYFDALKGEIRDTARAAAARLAGEGLNPVDQLVGTFGPAMEVFSRYDEVRTDTGQGVQVSVAIDEAADAVSAWRVEQLASRGLDGVEPEGRFALLCWDVLGAAEFRFNEAKLLGHAVSMDVDQLVTAGLVTKTGDKIKMLPARERRRSQPLEPDEVDETLFGPVTIPRKRRKGDVLKVHPNDPRFRTALDACHALALRFIEMPSSTAGIGAARALARQHQWTGESPVAKLMQALVQAAPLGVRFDTGKKSAAAEYPEFRAWHVLLGELFGVPAPDWAPPATARTLEDEYIAAEDEAENSESEESEGEEE